MGKVEAQMVGLNQRTSLVHMITQHAGQGLLQQVGGGVGTHDSLAALHINGSQHNIVHLDGAGSHGAMVQVLAALVLQHIFHDEAAVAHQDHTVVGHLAAHFGIERSLIQHDDAVFTTGDGAGNLVTDAHSQHLGLAVHFAVANKSGGGIIQAQINAGPS